jgi:hypothetical protein
MEATKGRVGKLTSIRSTIQQLLADQLAPLLLLLLLTYIPQTAINGIENAKFSDVRKMLPCAVLMVFQCYF